MVAANAQRITVAGNYPYAQLRPCGLKTGGYGSGSSVNGMHAIRVHIIGKPRGTSYAGNNDDIFPGYA